MRIYLFVLLALSVGCKQKSKSTFNTSSQFNTNSYHTDSRYKYEHRTGTSGDYTYNYDVSGTDEDGNDVSGNVDMNGKYGSGSITDTDGEERDVELEWVNKGELQATDDDGNTYDLEVDN